MVSFRCCFTSAETRRLIRDREPREGLSGTGSPEKAYLGPGAQRRLIRDREPREGLSGTGSPEKAYQGPGAQDGHLHFHAAPEL